jgi:hypothetical protein
MTHVDLIEKLLRLVGSRENEWSANEWKIQSGREGDLQECTIKQVMGDFSMVDCQTKGTGTRC